MKPQRIQLSRRKGFNLQAVSLALNGLPAVNCARPGKWGNPFKIGGWFKVGDPGGGYRGPLRMSWSQRAIWEPSDRAKAKSEGYTHLLLPAEAVQMLRDLLRASPSYFETKYPKRSIADLRGKNLACWCPLGSPCHCDVLLELANG